MIKLSNAIVTLTLIPQCPTLNSSKTFSYARTCFNSIFLTMCQRLVIGSDSIVCTILNGGKFSNDCCDPDTHTQTRTHTRTHARTHTRTIIAASDTA